MNEYINPDEFRKYLDLAKGEMAVASYLKEHPHPLYWSMCKMGGHTRYAFKEFPLGNQYKADFVLLNSYSGMWEVKFIELEPIDDLVFNKNGTPTCRLAGAIKQVDDWAEYFDKNQGHIREDLVRWVASKDILGYDSEIKWDSAGPANCSGDYLADPNSSLSESFHIIIGRRERMNNASHKRKATYKRRHNIAIRTYDMLLDLVDRRYADRAGVS